MRTAQLFGVLALGLALGMVPACGPRQQQEKQQNKEEDGDGHSHGNGPHKGTVADWAGGRYHVEFCMDHGKKQATVYILKGDAKTAAPIRAEKLRLKIEEPPFEMDLKAMPQEDDPDGTSSRFAGTHENFAKEQDFAGTISAKVQGKSYTGRFEEKDH